MELRTLFAVVGAVLVVVQDAGADDSGMYDIGVGIADITGPAAEVNMLGYAKMSEDTTGIHTRQYSRAFIIGDKVNRVLFVSLDTGMAAQLVYLEVLKKLREKYGDLYTEKNVAISSIHTHATPGGFLQYVLYIVTSQGFIRQSLDGQVEGIVKSIDRAHESIAPGYIFKNEGDLYNASINRSPTSYLNNPPEERQRYPTNVDTKMVLLKLTDANKNPRGMINWFAVHCTSMNNSNTLISGDNKGYASMMFEKAMNGKDSLPGKGPFVAAFAQSNEGDVSPNILGPRCIDTGLPCDTNTSTCNGKNDKCIAFGPGKDMFESTRIIGERQYEKAIELYNSATQRLTGPVESIHQFVDMSKVPVLIKNSYTINTCKPAMGYSFAAGTTDGPGSFDFTQGTTSTSVFWNIVRDFIKRPSKETKECHHPKPILLSTGEMKFPYDWQPDILPTQILKIGSLAILPVPGEFTTMSGRRLREAVKQVFDGNSALADTTVVIAGLSNSYTSYIATFEEYQVQRYEGASTIYGPHTLQAYIQQFKKLATSLIQQEDMPAGPPLPNLLARQISLKPGVIYDNPPFFKRFGQVLSDVDKSYPVGSTVSVTFVSGHPRNNLRLEDTFLTVEMLEPGSTDSWKVIATDANWETKYHWKRSNVILGSSKATLTWEIPLDTPPGKYRVRHFGNSKSMTGKISAYSGTSSTFEVTNGGDHIRREAKPDSINWQIIPEKSSQFMSSSGLASTIANVTNFRSIIPSIT